MLDVHIPATRLDNVAWRCLAQTEGLTPTCWSCSQPTDYSDMLVALWRTGRGFIVVEDDIAPFPGAVEGLARCGGVWCCHDYPLWGGHLGLGSKGLGCMKFSDHLVREHPRLWMAWLRTPWRELDHAVQQAVRHATLREGPHVHTPPVAHAQGFRLPTP